MMIDELLQRVREEIIRAGEKFPPMNSAHEAYAVLLEEMDELWTEIKRKPQERDAQAITNEAVQVAAMAMRLISDIVDSGRINLL